MNPGPPEPTLFTQADLAAYDAELQQGLALSGENKTYFARGRLAWLAGQLPARGLPAPRRILDYGCGGGDTTLQLARQWPAARVVGTDPADSLLAVARRADREGRCEFRPLSAMPEDEHFDLIYCNGVFHHIPAADQPAALAWIHDRLAPAGIFSLWENNSWSPAARWVMSRIPFDRDAVMLAPHRTRRLLQQAGFAVLACDFLFFFPRALRWLRPLEPRLRKLPFGAQYQVLSRRADGLETAAAG